MFGIDMEGALRLRANRETEPAVSLESSFSAAEIFLQIWSNRNDPEGATPGTLGQDLIPSRREARSCAFAQINARFCQFTPADDAWARRQNAGISQARKARCIMSTETGGWKMPYSHASNLHPSNLHSSNLHPLISGLRGSSGTERAQGGSLSYRYANRGKIHSPRSTCDGRPVCRWVQCRSQASFFDRPADVTLHLGRGGPGGTC